MSEIIFYTCNMNQKPTNMNKSLRIIAFVTLFTSVLLAKAQLLYNSNLVADHFVAGLTTMNSYFWWTRNDQMLSSEGCILNTDLQVVKGQIIQCVQLNNSLSTIPYAAIEQVLLMSKIDLTRELPCASD